MSRSPNELRLAMWSGPRNISTAMMRSWGNRNDSIVCDEPFYAHYLHVTQKDHPGKDEVIAAGETDWRKVVTRLTGPIPDGRRVFYQKHMTHHLLPHIDRSWLAQVTNCFLIRHPRDVLTSYIKIVPDPADEDTGFPQQLEIFQWVSQHTGKTPLVVDSVDVLNAPRRILGLLCDALNLDFQETMLTWETGLRPTDGVWAKYWYKEVETTTGFRPYKPKPDQVPTALIPLYERCLASYETLYKHRLR